MNRIATVLLAAIPALIATAEAGPPQLAPRFSDGMVLQRESPIIVEGTAEAGSSVAVTLGEVRSETKADETGRWAVEIEPLEAARALSLTASSDQGSDERRNILIGDVFLCSGQSNLAYPVSRALNPDTELSGPFSADIRLLKVPQKSSVLPEPALPEGAMWRSVDRDSVADFSAVCYFFGRDHTLKTGVPIGLIDSSWGGSRIEAWISPDGLSSDPAFSEGLSMLRQYASDPVAAMTRFGATWEGWWGRAVAGYRPWASGLATPEPVPGPHRDWKTYGDPELDTHLGLVWFEHEFELEPSANGAAATLSLGAMDEIDSVWVNGTFISTTFGWGTPRTYSVPPGLVRSGPNRITVSVFNGWGAGGMTGPGEVMQLALSDGTIVPIADGWSYERVDPSIGSPPSTPWQSVSGLSGMHHAMISPLAGMRLAGVLWYQGESNTGEAHAYEGLLERLAADFRRQFGSNLQILVVQLPEFGARMTTAADSGWSNLREAQRRFTDKDAHSGLVVTLGAGDPWDIHPPNKQEVARRAAGVWPAIGTSNPARTGYSPVSISRKGRTIRVVLPEAVGAYSTPGSNGPAGFIICDQDNDCRFWDASLNGQQIVLKKAPKDAAIVRYCWGDTPFCNLTAPDGTPVTPFELAIP